MSNDWTAFSVGFQQSFNNAALRVIEARSANEAKMFQLQLDVVKDKARRIEGVREANYKNLKEQIDDMAKYIGVMVPPDLAALAPAAQSELAALATQAAPSAPHSAERAAQRAAGKPVVTGDAIAAMHKEVDDEFLAGGSPKVPAELFAARSRVNLRELRLADEKERTAIFGIMNATVLSLTEDWNAELTVDEDLTAWNAEVTESVKNRTVLNVFTNLRARNLFNRFRLQNEKKEQDRIARTAGDKAEAQQANFIAQLDSLGPEAREMGGLVENWHNDLMNDVEEGIPLTKWNLLALTDLMKARRAPKPSVLLSLVQWDDGRLRSTADFEKEILAPLGVDLAVLKDLYNAEDDATYTVGKGGAAQEMTALDLLKNRYPNVEDSNERRKFLAEDLRAAQVLYDRAVSRNNSALTKGTVDAHFSLAEALLKEREAEAERVRKRAAAEGGS